MNFILGAAGMIILLYFGTGYLPIAPDNRIKVAIWGGIALSILGAIGRYMEKAKAMYPWATASSSLIAHHPCGRHD